MRKKGAYTIGQDKESSVVYGMPGVAQNIGAVMIQASCENVSKYPEEVSTVLTSFLIIR